MFIFLKPYGRYIMDFGCFCRFEIGSFNMSSYVLVFQVVELIGKSLTALNDQSSHLLCHYILHVNLLLGNF
jgi:hypothetical protein